MVMHTHSLRCSQFLDYLPPTTLYALLATVYSPPITHHVATPCALLTTHHSLLSTLYSLLTTHYSLLTAHHPPPTTHHQPLTARYSLLTSGDPSLLRRDAYSGDYGIGLYGYWRSAAAYIDCSPIRGWECMLCDILDDLPEGNGRPEMPSSLSKKCSGRVTIAPRDALHRRAYIAPLGLMLSVEGAQLMEVAIDMAAVVVTLSIQRHGAAPSTTASLFAKVERVYPPPIAVSGGLRVFCPNDRPGESCARGGLHDAFVITLGGHPLTTVKIEPAVARV